jgi:hypothetical protein
MTPWSPASQSPNPIARELCPSSQRAPRQRGQQEPAPNANACARAVCATRKSSRPARSRRAPTLKRECPCGDAITAVTQEKQKDEEKSASGPLEMPADLYNGMALVLLKNLLPGARASVQLAAFTPKSRLIKMELSAEGEERVSIGGQAKKVIRYLVNLEVGGLIGALASLVGKEPPDQRYWLVAGEVPAFIRFQGAMFLNGPVWRLEMATVEWPR